MTATATAVEGADVVAAKVAWWCVEWGMEAVVGILTRLRR
jgi:hypothetical protein